MSPCFSSAKSRRGHTLAEMVMAMASATVLMAGLGGAVVVASRAFRPETGATYSRTNAALSEHDLLANLRLATGFTERTDKAATFTVPDRDGDGNPETLRYAWSGTTGDPLTLSYNGGAPLPVASDVRAFSLAYATQTVAGVNLPAEQTGSQILLLVNDSQNPTANELARKTLMESWNFVIVMRGLNDGTNAIVSAAGQSQAVYVSGTLNAASFSGAASLAALSVGIVNEHPDLADEFGFAASTTHVPFGTQVAIANVSHYIITGLPSGNVSVGYPGGMYSLGGTLATNLNILGTVSGAPGLATVDPGKLLIDGRTAAGRRVMVPWGGANTDPTNWNATGQMLTCRAIEWATGLGDESLEIKKFGYETVFASQNGSANVQYSVKATVTDTARLRSITAYVGGANDQVRFAIYSDSGGNPGPLIVQSEVGTTTTSMAWVTLPVPATDLVPGNYWLAFLFKNSNQKYRYIATYSGAGERNKAHDFNSAFINPWGTSNNSYNGARSIYATYEVLP